MATTSVSAHEASPGTRSKRGSKENTRSTKGKRPDPEGLSSLSFVRHGRHQRTNWMLPPPPENYVEAQRVCSDGGVMDRDTALYGIGCEQGIVAAREYLEMLKRYPLAGRCGGLLQHIVLDMMKTESTSHLRGQVVGFFTTLEKGLI